jgi:hypothetical protein
MKIFILILVVISGCKNDEYNPLTPNKSNHIIPLSVGNQWLAKAERIANDGSTISTFYFGLSIIAKNLIYSSDTYILEMSYGSQFSCENTDSGFVWKFDSRNYLQYKYPANVGDKYINSGNTYKTVIAVDTTIVTEYGKFNCYHYSTRHNDNEPRTKDFHTEEFISPNYGFIYKEHYQTDGPTPEIFLYSKIAYNPILVN